MKNSILLIAMSIFTLQASAQKSTAYKASLQKATVFLQGAEMEHSVKVPIALGSSEIVIENLADWIDENSIQVGTDVDISILSATLAKDHVDEKPVLPISEAAKKQLDAAILETKKTVNLMQAEEAILKLLEANKRIGGSNTGVNLIELMKTADYVRSKTAEVKNNILLLEQKLGIQNELVAKLQKQLNEVAGVSDKEKGRIVLQVNSTVAQQAMLRISYLTQNAWWKPVYDIKVGGSTTQVSLAYKAEIHQSTGVDWNKIKLSLASSLPNQYGTAPLLQGWYLSYAQYEQEVVVTGYGTRGRDNRGMNSLSMNRAPNAEKRSTDINGNLVKEQTLSDYVTVTQNPIFVSFDIDLPYNIPTNGKAYSVQMKDYTLPASLKYYAVPKLDKDVYLLAQITNWENLNLLPGEANVILNGTYVGKTALNVVSTDTLSITVGKDKRVVVKREKIVDYSSKKFLASSKTQKFTYEITVRNTNTEAIKFHLKDQIPLTTDKSIEVSLDDNGGGELNADLGVLNWLLELKPKETRKIKFTYTVKYAKDKIIENL
jgi:uncharacterized protein (TIGR02231 family)